ncbi:MAG: AAA family ATPase, partial [Acidobacteriota bacterium]
MDSVPVRPQTPRAEVRLLGGFEVRVDGRPVSGFESQKVRGLLAYLLVGRGTAHGRERLAELFWPDHEPAAARSSLRQALYNLRSALGQGDGWQPVVATHQSVAISPGPEVWLDVEAFEHGLRRGLTDGGPIPHVLDPAVQLYRGDFLSGCPVRAGAELDDWIEEQQERLREGAIQALRTLIAHHSGRGGPGSTGGNRLAIQHAQRLLALDVLSEETHRQLMALYSASGRRGRALSQYEDLRHRLDRELGVEPSEETDALYRAILREERVAGERGEGVEPVGPVFPLVGRDSELSALRRVWGAVQRGAGAFTLLEGEPGVGKSRLAKSFLSEAGKTAGAVLLARCQGFEPEVPYQPIRDALRNEVGEETDAAGLALAGAPAELVAEIARLLPELGRPDLPVLFPSGDAAARDRLADAVWQVLRRLTALSGRRARPVLVLLEDLHLADRTTLGLLERLLPR